MIRTLQTFSTKLDINGFDIIDTLEGYRVDYCGAETGDIWTAVLVADTYEEASDAIKSISDGIKIMFYTLAIQNEEGIATGEYHSEIEPVVGETVTVTLHDQNGNLMVVAGKVIEILDIKEY